MTPKTQKELDAIQQECYAMVTKRSALAAGTSAIPTPGVDIAADITILLELIPTINRKFGLSKDQIDDYDPLVKQAILTVIKTAGAAMIGTEVTKIVITQALKKVAGRAITKQALKFIPIVGWAANAAIGFTAMKYVGDSHVDDCFDVCKRIISQQEHHQSDD